MKYIVKTPHFRYDGELYSTEIDGSTLYDMVDDWLRAEIGRRWDAWDWPDCDTFTFVEETDAVAFKLRWL